MIDKFQKGSSTYKCTSCGKRTRDTGAGEAQFKLCRSCYLDQEYENAHDNGEHDDKYIESCELCRKKMGRVQ